MASSVPGYNSPLLMALALIMLAGVCSAQTSSPDPQAIANFRASPNTLNATAIRGSCPAIPAGGDVFEIHRLAVARRKCLAEVENMLVAALAEPTPGIADTTARAMADSSKQAAALELANTKDDARKTEDVVETSGAAKSFMGSNWGVGIGYSFGRGAKRITEAELVDNIVRVKQDDTDQPIVLLEVHHFFNPGNDRFAWGPYASIQTGTDDAVVGFGGGLLFGWRDADPKAAGGFLVGVGYGWTHGVKTLGDGLVANQALPGNESEIRYKNRSAGALMVFVSRRFNLNDVAK